MNDDNRFKAYLDRFMQRSLTKEAAQSLPLFDAWRETVGDLASHCVLRDLTAGSLLVDVDHPGWMQLFQMKQEEILQKLRRRFPDVPMKTWRVRLVESLAGPKLEKEISQAEPEFAPTQAIPQERIVRNSEIQDENLAKLLNSLDDLSSQKK